uniref:Kazal-like domain-containing protein n=1 Tax=Panagrolaimus sp. JU765 TaxID=591449 RepID=A0AC34QTC5_9BILA
MFIKCLILFIPFLNFAKGLNFTLAGKCSCPMKVEPVCGSVGDSHHTFMNQCVLNCTKESKSDVHHLYDGVCCKLSPQCEPFDSPVCDQNGKVYETRCLFEHARCINLKQKNIHLKINMNFPTCRCVKQCTSKKEPVCDINGNTHPNLCSFMNAKCIAKMTQDRDLEIDYLGECCRNLCTNDHGTLPICDSENKTHQNLCSFLKYRCEIDKRFGKKMDIGFKSFGVCPVLPGTGFSAPNINTNIIS